MKKLLGNFKARGEKNKLTKPNKAAAIDKHGEPLVRTSIFSRKPSVRRRPATASRILDDYPSPPDALQPVGDLLALPNIDNLPSLLDSTSGVGQYDADINYSSSHSGGMDFGTFELPKERGLPSVKQGILILNGKTYGKVNDIWQENATPGHVADAREERASGLPPSPIIDMSAAMQLMEGLRNTASPEELAVLRK
jgi:hypothetical protein